MRADFNIRVHSNSENIHIKLLGDLDTKAIDMLALHIDKSCKKFRKVFIHTNDLNRIDDSSKKLLKDKIDVNAGDMFNLKFAREHAVDIAPYPFQII